MLCLPAEAHEAHRTAAEQAAAFPAGAQGVSPAAAAVGAHSDIMGGNPHGDAVRSVLVLFRPAIERGLDVAGLEAAVAAKLDWRSALDCHRCGLERVPRIDGRDGERAAVAISCTAQGQWDRLPLLHDSRWLVLAAAPPRDPHPKAGNDECGECDQLAKIDPAAAGSCFGGFVHRPPASSKRRGAASSQLAAIRSATWSQSTLLPTRLIDNQLGRYAGLE